MATIKELTKEINDYLYPNIDRYSSKEIKTYKINETWIDLIEDKYFTNESIFLLQKIENTILKSEEPILIITRLHHIFKKRIVELQQLSKQNFEKHLRTFHRVSEVDFNETKIKKEYEKKCKNKVITQKIVDEETQPETELYKLKSFLKMPFMLALHKKEDLENKKLIYHLDQFMREANQIFTVLDEIIYDYENFKMVIYDDYFKSYYKINSRKIQLDLKLKDVAYFYHFVLEMGFFKFHPERRMNKKLLINFFENNFMYTDQNSNKPKEFINLIKHASDAAKESVRFKDGFIKEMTNRYEEFSKINLQKVERYYIPN